MNTAEDTPENEKNERKQDGRQKENRPDPAEDPVKEFEEYLLDIGVRI